MTAIETDDLDRNWLWIGIDASQRLAVFQSRGEGALPFSVRSSLDDAETIDEFVSAHLINSPGYCTGNFRHDCRRYSWRDKFPSAKYDEDWDAFVNGGIRTASCGIYVYYAQQGGMLGELPVGYYQAAFPSTPLTIDGLPRSIRGIVARTVFHDSFSLLHYIHPDVVENVGDPASCDNRNDE